MRPALLLLPLVLLAGCVAPGSPSAGASTPPTPTSIAAIGDSITRAFDACCRYGEHPRSSWSTGGASHDGVRSQYERIVAAHPRASVRRYNDARSGAKMAAGPGQARMAVSQHAEYVTILLGANDLCTSSPSTMTSVARFRSEFHQTLQTLLTGLPKRAHVFVASIPDISQLWQIYHSDTMARAIWSFAGICQSLLAPDRTRAQRQLFRQRNVAFNAVLAKQCSLYRRCRFDGGAVFDYRFRRKDVSRLDFFHPSLSGQGHLAQVTWAKSWWG